LAGWAVNQLLCSRTNSARFRSCASVPLGNRATSMLVQKVEPRMIQAARATKPVSVQQGKLGRFSRPNSNRRPVGSCASVPLGSVGNEYVPGCKVTRERRGLRPHEYRKCGANLLAQVQLASIRDQIQRGGGALPCRSAALATSMLVQTKERGVLGLPVQQEQKYTRCDPTWRRSRECRL